VSGLAPSEGNLKERIKMFPCWAGIKREKWLSRKAFSGWMLSDVGYGVIYRFKKSEKRKLRFAVEYLGKNPDIPGEIENDRAAGWEFLGRFGKYRYYYREEDIPGEPAHPAADNQIEQGCLRSITTNLITLLLLNIPGTLYCMAYLGIFFIGGGFLISDLIFETENGVLYLLGGILGIVGYVFLFRWLVMTRKRLKFILKGRSGEA
jgi:hypothetical protein